MRILVDENVPAPVLGVLRTLLPGHEVQGVRDIQWTGRADRAVLADAAGRGFHAFLTRDDGQLDDPAQRAAVRASGLHHIRYGQAHAGRAGLGRAMGAVITAITRIADELDAAEGPRLVRITARGPGARYDVTAGHPTDDTDTRQGPPRPRSGSREEGGDPRGRGSPGREGEGRVRVAVQGADRRQGAGRPKGAAPRQGAGGLRGADPPPRAGERGSPSGYG